MSFDLKYIGAINVPYKVFFSKDIDKKIYRESINLSVPDTNQENDLNILCIDGLYGYRTGLIGYIVHLLSSVCGPYKTFILKSIFNYLFRMNFQCSDIDFVAGLLSIVNRNIPLLNFGIWDHKVNFFDKNDKNWKYMNTNHSTRGMFDIYSNFFLQPFFDSGICIFSNHPCDSSGFTALKNPVNLNVNEGFVWSFYKKGNKGILIIALNISDNFEMKLKEMAQLSKLKDELFNKLSSPKILRFETYIVVSLVQKLQFESNYCFRKNVKRKYS